MNDINWHQFKAKFNGREQEIFERLSYMLFWLEQVIQGGKLNGLDAILVEGGNKNDFEMIIPKDASSSNPDLPGNLISRESRSGWVREISWMPSEHHRFPQSAPLRGNV